ncbi:MAG: pyrroline-5-carboxylate reductase [Nannocystaceae bacterium]|nr:pyrroline-5-carboxylate reductase [Myxococcales bacterium]
MVSDAALAASLAIVGCGTMGSAIAAGLLRARVVPPEALVVTTRRREGADAVQQRLGVAATTDNAAAIGRADVVLLCLKPQALPAIVSQPAIAAALEGRLVISVAAGVTLTQLAELMPKSALIRAMPNTPALIGAGMTVLARGEGVDDAQIAVATRVFTAVGDCVELEDRHMDAVTSLCGSGPAFSYVVLEAMADGGVMMGLPRAVALRIAARVCEGAARMVLDTKHHPAALKDQVTTPAGCTIAGLLTMEDGRIRSVIARAIQEAARVAGELGRSGSR